MADVAVVSISTSTPRGQRSLVFTTADVGYQFYITTGGGFSYKKTTDGGATWSAAVPIGTAPSCIGFDVWFDQWTPGDTGTLIHTWFFDTTVDDVLYRTLDTNGDTLGTQRVVFAGATAVAGIGVFVSGTKAVGGNLYCAFDIDAGAELGFYRSTDGGVNWASRDATLVEATGDWARLFPANVADPQDIWALYFDADANALTLKEHDDSAGTTSESATIVTIVENTTDLTGQYPFSASLRHSDGHLIIDAVTERDTATSDHRVFDVNGTGSIVEKTAITTNIDDHYYTAVFIDQTTDDIYVTYVGKRDGTEVLGSTVKAYYTKSTDGGTTWTTGDTAYMEAAAGNVQQTWTPLMGPRFYVTWRQASTLLQGNAVNSVTFTAGVTGTVSITEALDTLASSGNVVNDGALAAAEANDTLDASGSLPLDISGSLAATEALDTLSASGVLIVSGAVSAVEANDTSASTGALAVIGSTSVVETNDILSATGGVAVSVTGNLAVTEEDDSASAVGEVEIPTAADAPTDGSGLRIIRRKRKPEQRPKLHPEEIARQQRENERYLAELGKKKALQAKPAPTLVPKPPPAEVLIRTDALARAAPVKLVDMARASSAEVLAQQAMAKRQRVLVLLALL
jgi:hypothetical protein